MAYESMSFAVGYSAEYGGIQNSLFQVQKKIDKTMERLSTGKRVNDMKDDEGGKAVADVLSSWKKGTDEAIYNLKEFITMTKTAEKALNDIQDVLLEMKEIMKLVPGRFVTIAPETGEKLRFLLGKRFTDDEIVEIVECAKRYGIKAVKLYFMIGLPFERVEEIKEIVDKVKRVGVKVYASFSIFVPKPHTPLQFSKLNTVEELERKNAFIRKNLRVSKLHLTNPKRAILQAVLSIGGIDVANALLKVYTNGLNFSVWKKHVCIDKYLEEKIDWDFEFENIKSMVERKTLEKIYVKFKKKATDTLSTCSHTSCT
jgi:hypothetical protein